MVTLYRNINEDAVLIPVKSLKALIIYIMPGFSSYKKFIYDTCCQNDTAYTWKTAAY